MVCRNRQAEEEEKLRNKLHRDESNYEEETDTEIEEEKRVGTTRQGSGSKSIKREETSMEDNSVLRGGHLY